MSGPDTAVGEVGKPRGWRVLSGGPKPALKTRSLVDQASGDPRKTGEHSESTAPRKSVRSPALAKTAPEDR